MTQRKRYKILYSMCIQILFVALLIFSSCQYYELEKNLKPEYAEFYNKIRYIITQKEKKIFLELPDSEKKNFQEEFWKKRDPFPETKENEFKTIYFNRIEEANELFFGEGRPGWSTDRGRIYILYGSPTSKRTHSHPSYNNRCGEIWYYENYPVVFIDQFCIGQYKLATFDLTPIHHLNIKNMGKLNMVPSKSQQRIKQNEEILFDFNWNIKKTVVKPEIIQGAIEINIPYANLWFKEENDTLLTFIDAAVEIRGINNQPLWDHQQDYRIEINERLLRKKTEEVYRIEIPFVFDDEKTLNLLRKGENKVFAILKNRTSGKTVRKVQKAKF